MKRIFVGAALLAFASLASAADPWYIGGGLGQSDFGDCASGGCDQSKEAYKVFGGYRLSRNLALEAGYVDLGKITTSSGEAVIENKPRGFAAHVVGMWPLVDRLSLLGRIGLVYGDSKVTGSVTTRNEKGTNLAWGLGAQYAFDANIIVRVDWDRYRFEALGAKTDIDTVMLVFMTTF